MELPNFEDSNEARNIFWKILKNDLLSYDSIVFNNITKNFANDDCFCESPAKLGIATGLFITCLADFRILNFKNYSKNSFDFLYKIRKMTVTIFNLTCFCLLAPIVTTALMLLYAYRNLVKIILSVKYKDKFVGLLDGTDCVWALEEPTSLSVVNILAILEKDTQMKIKNNNDILENFRMLAKSRLLTSKFEKLQYRRKKQYGYFFWVKSNPETDLENRIKWLQDEHMECDGSCDNINGHYLRELLAKICNDPLPDDHEASWEILIGRTCTKATSGSVCHMEEGRILRNDTHASDKIRTPILFRVHHSLGDGVALLRLLLEAIADPEDILTIQNEESWNDSFDFDRQESDCQDIKIPLPVRTEDGTWNSYNVDIISDFKKEVTSRLVTSYADVLSCRKDILSATMPFTSSIAIRITGRSIQNYIYSYLKFFNHVNVHDLSAYVIKLTNDQRRRLTEWKDRIFGKISYFTEVMMILIEAPFCLVDQALRSMDNSAIHGPKLTGEKIISCWVESDFENKNEETLLLKIRSIKNAIGARFEDVVLAALSSSLHKYFIQVNESIPKTVTVILPARMSSMKKDLCLENGFSVGLLPLCVRQVNGVCIDAPNGNFKSFQRLLDVSRRSEKLRRDLDYRINYWVMTWLSAALPEVFLKPILESHSTLVFSNLQGPEEVQILGHVLKSIAFWMPHRGSTGIGYSVLSYNGNLNLSLIADKALISNEKLLSDILENTVREIERLYDIITLTCFSRKLYRRMAAPM
ncbi:uncharacterized protein LOC107274419 [Cephus cinctus]|uniref:Uncharacterized protein LOC107274419 n=1 Tax=Cephus cinctus TaxID=211228 RepID=A0AAJ7CET1_CEPCN|nr:uncharacterized protein LOC107274419 [Cephus cinctus]